MTMLRLAVALVVIGLVAVAAPIGSAESGGTTSPATSNTTTTSASSAIGPPGPGCEPMCVSS